MTVRIKIAATCLYPGCDKPAAVRGLCKTHYSALRSMLKSGTADEQDLIKRGLLLPARVRSKNAAFRKGSTETGQG